MALFITTKAGTTGAQLLALIEKGIEEESIETWVFNQQTGFTHDTSDGTWNKGAYLQLQTSNDPQRLILYYKYPSGATIIDATYGILNGRFSEMLLNHFSEQTSFIKLQDLRKRP